jgi:hypothetical protein
VFVAAEQHQQAVAPEELAEDARRPEHPARVGAQRLEPGLRHGQDRLGESAAAPGGLYGAPTPLGCRPDHLLQVERVAARLLRDPRHVVAGHRVAEHLPHELLAGPARQLPQADRAHAALAPEVREPRGQLGAPGGDHHQRRAAELAQGRVEQLHRGVIGPVQILEHEEHRPRRALGGEQILPRLRHLIAHERVVEARRAKIEAVLVGERHTRELPEETRHPGRLGGRDVLRHARRELPAALLERLPVADPGGVAHHPGEQAEGRSGGGRITARGQHGRARGPLGPRLVLGLGLARSCAAPDLQCRDELADES